MLSLNNSQILRVIRNKLFRSINCIIISEKIPYCKVLKQHITNPLIYSQYTHSIDEALTTQGVHIKIIDSHILQNKLITQSNNKILLSSEYMNTRPSVNLSVNNFINIIYPSDSHYLDQIIKFICTTAPLSLFLSSIKLTNISTDILLPLANSDRIQTKQMWADALEIPTNTLTKWCFRDFSISVDSFLNFYYTIRTTLEFYYGCQFISEFFEITESHQKLVESILHLSSTNSSFEQVSQAV